jgi:hypothetical protein
MVLGGAPLRQEPVDPPQQPPQHGPVVPAAADHPLPNRAHPRPQPGCGGGAQLVLTLGYPTLQEPDAPEADPDLGMRAQPDKMLFIEPTTAAPTRRRSVLGALRRDGHDDIICLDSHEDHQASVWSPSSAALGGARHGSAS